MSAAPFEAMARRIEKIDSAEFAGAVVIVPPGDEGAIQLLMSNPDPDLVLFWSSLQSLIQVRATEAVQNEDVRRQQSRAFGR